MTLRQADEEHFVFLTSPSQPAQPVPNLRRHRRVGGGARADLHFVQGLHEEVDPAEKSLSLHQLGGGLIKGQGPLVGGR